MLPVECVNPLTGEGLCEEDSLEHEGVKGMKWHQHRFGRWQSHARYAHGRSNPNKKKSKAAKAKAKAIKKKVKAAEAEARAEKRAEKKEARLAKKKAKIARDPTALYKNRDMFTKEEINEAMQRFEWEKKLRSYSTEQIKSAKTTVTNVVDGLESGIKGYNQVARIYNSFSQGSKMPYIEDVPKKDKDDKKNGDKK